MGVVKQTSERDNLRISDEVTMDFQCVMCHDNLLCDENFQDHARNAHNVKFEVDLLLVMQLLTKEEKLSLMKQTERRMIEFKEIDLKNDNVLGVTPKHDEQALNSNKKPKIANNAGDESVAKKIRFWKGKEKDSFSPKQAVKEINHKALNFFRKVEPRNEKVVNQLLRRTLSQHVLGQKSADDTIEIFDEIFATTCDPDLDDSIDGPFKLLLEDVDICEEEVDHCIPADKSVIIDDEVSEDLLKAKLAISSEDEASENLIVMPKRKARLAASKTTLSANEKYECAECGKSFKFL